jgi:thiamine biosynthesis lipoprotein
MGTMVNLTVISQDGKENQATVRNTFDEMQRWIEFFDHRNPNSSISKLNHHGVLQNPQPEVRLVFEKAINYAELTNGAFDVTVKPVLDAYRRGSQITPELRSLADYRQILLGEDRILLSRSGGQVTLDGIAKGAVIDAGVAALGSHGYDNVLVEAGGDMMASGCRGDDVPWRIGIKHPRNENEAFLTQFDINNFAVATSGDYQFRFSTDFSSHHILNPVTGESPPELASVTVLAPTALDADALSTAVMVLGPDSGLELIDHLDRIEALIVTKEIKIYTSEGFPI